MTITKIKKRAIICSIIAVIFVITISILVYIESEYFNNESNDNLIKDIFPQKILYLESNKDLTELFVYDTSSKDNEIVFSDSKNEYKINNVAYINNNASYIIASENRIGYSVSRLVKIDLKTKKESIIVEPMNLETMTSDSEGVIYSGILTTPNSFKLIYKNIDTHEYNLIKTFTGQIESVVFNPNKLSWLIKQKDSDIELISSNSKIINDTKQSVINFKDSDNFIFSQNNKIYSLNLNNGDKTYLTDLQNTPTSIYWQNNCIGYTYNIETENFNNAKLSCNNKIRDLDFTATKILKFIYEK